MVLYASATGQQCFWQANTQMLKKEVKSLMDSKISSLSTGAVAATLNKTLVSFIGTIFSIVRKSMRSKLNNFFFYPTVSPQHSCAETNNLDF